MLNSPAHNKALSPRLLFWTVFIGSCSAYIALEVFFNQAMLYIIGGLVGTMTKAIGIRSVTGWLLVWSAIPAVILLSFTATSNKTVLFKVASTILVAILLYVIDAWIIFNSPDGFKGASEALLQFFVPALKGLILACMVRFES